MNEIYVQNYEYIQEGKNVTLQSSPRRKAESLARSTSRNILALAALLSTGNAVTSPSPVRAATLSAKNVDVSSLGSNCALDILDIQAGNGDASGGNASGGTVLVVLLDDNAVLANVLESDVLVCDAAYRASGTGNGLDSDAIVRVDDGGGKDLDV